MLEGIGAAARSTDAHQLYPAWFRDKGIDARCNSSVMGIDLQSWLIDNSRWYTLESEIHAGHPLNVGREASSFMFAVDADRIDIQNEEPHTLLFITRDGGRGILQVFPREQPASYARKIRYRLWHEQDRPAPAAPPKRTPRHESDWGPERLVILKAPGRDRAFLLNLETGQKVTPPDSLVPAQIRPGDSFSNHKELAAWCRARGVNIGTVAAWVSGTNDSKSSRSATIDLVGLEMNALCVLPSSFEEMTLPELKELVARWPLRDEGAWMGSLSEPRRDTYVIVTKSGTMGLLQIRAIGDQHDSIAFRYRLAKNGSHQD
jgi:hypothetical protein